MATNQQPQDELFTELLGKAGQSQVGMWGAMANALGFMIGAASVIAAVSSSGRAMLFPVIGFGMIGMLLIFLCFYYQKKMYVQMIERLPGFRKLSEEEKIKQIEEEIWRPNPVQRLEKGALLVLAATAALFLFFCLISFDVICV